MRIACTCIDSGGHHTQSVYAYAKKRNLSRIFAIKGSPVAGKPIISKPSRTGKLNVKLFSIGTDTAKEMIYSRLRITEPGAGYCHFPSSRDEEYFKQLTAEKVVTRYHKGFPVRMWEKKPGQRNEALDCRVYAIAALNILNPNLELLADKMRESMTPVNDQGEDENEDSNAIYDRFRAKQPWSVKYPKKTGGFVKNW